jgi:hypothetical protein
VWSTCGHWHYSFGEVQRSSLSPLLHPLPLLGLLLLLRALLVVLALLQACVAEWLTMPCRHAS